MGKAKKDPNAPKRPLSGYMLFCQEERAKVKEDMPELKAKEILSELGKRWNDLDDDSKAEFNDQSKEAMEQYKKDMEEYKANKESDDEDEDEDDEPKKKKRKAKAKKDPNAPKKPLTSFFLFSGDVRSEVKAENPDMKAKDVAKEIATRWAALDDDEKKKYTDAYKEAKIAYDEEMEEYNGGEKPSKKQKVVDDDDDDDEDEDDE